MTSEVRGKTMKNRCNKLLKGPNCILRTEYELIIWHFQVQPSINTDNCITNETEIRTIPCVTESKCSKAIPRVEMQFLCYDSLQPISLWLSELLACSLPMQRPHTRWHQLMNPPTELFPKPEIVHNSLLEYGAVKKKMLTSRTIKFLAQTHMKNKQESLLDLEIWCNRL